MKAGEDWSVVGCLMVSARFPGYLGTEDGRVFSIRSRRFLRPIKAGKYLAVSLSDHNGQQVRMYVHRFIAELVRGHIPDGLEVCHNDGNPMNNAAANLRWDTRSGNFADKRAHGTATIGERHPMARLSEQQVREIRQRVASGVPQRRLCAEYGVSPMAISRAVRGVSWSHV